MLNAVMLAWYGSYGGPIGNVFAQMEQVGLFTYLLPFLLIFAVVFGVLTKIGLFEDKTINAIIALAVGLISVNFEMVPQFFSEIFPRVGVGIGVLLMVFIIFGLFLDSGKKSHATKWIIAGVGGVIAIIIFWTTADSVGWGFGWWFEEYWPALAVGVFILIIIGVIVGNSEDPSKIPDYAPYWGKGKTS